jgi:fumarate reductase subunit D
MFLPVHLYVLALALDGPANLDRFLNWTDTPLLKLSEAGLVIVLAAHMAGGLRLLAVEFLPWSESQKTYIALGAAVAMGAGILFGLQAF